MLYKSVRFAYISDYSFRPLPAPSPFHTSRSPRLSGTVVSTLPAFTSDHALSLLFSCSSALFYPLQSAISNIFFIFQTLCSKTPGVGIPRISESLRKEPRIVGVI